MRRLILVLLALATLETHAQGLPSLMEFVRAEDAKSRRIEPMSKHDFAKHLPTQAGKRAWLLGIDMKDAAHNAEKVLRRGSPYYLPTVTDVSTECERIANTVYRLYMYAHANAEQMARTRGKAGSLEYEAAHRAMDFGRSGLRELMENTGAFRDQLSRGKQIPPRALLDQLSIQDLRTMLDDEGLQVYRKQNLVPSGMLDSAAALPRAEYKKDSPGARTEATVKCAIECARTDWSGCGRCSRLLMENAEKSYSYFAIEWNANSNWYQLWRRVELTDHVLGMLAAGYSPPKL